MRFAIALAMFVLGGAASASAIDEYGYAWPLVLEPGRGAHRLVLSEAVYSRIGDTGLRDLEAFNASGDPIPLGPVPLALGDPETRVAAEQLSLPWFALPRDTRGDDTGISVHIERDAEGRLRHFDADVAAPDTQDDVAVDLVLDASSMVGSHADSARPATLEALELGWETTTPPAVSARFHVLGSDDFTHWYTLVPEASVMDLSQGNFRLTRRRIELPNSSARYLKLMRLDAGPSLVVARVTGHSRPVSRLSSGVAARAWSNTKHRRTTQQPQAYEYRTVGPMQVERIALRLASPNSVTRVTLESRDSESAPWTLRQELTAFRIESAGSTLVHDDLDVGPTRDRHWRAVASPPLDQPPALRVGYRPDEFALLEQGPAPFTLAAGSAVARRDDYPMTALLGAVSATIGHEWQLPLARLAAPHTLRGAAALEPPPRPRPVKMWALWAILGFGVVAVIAMVLRLLNSPAQT